MFYRHPDDAGSVGGSVSLQDLETRRKFWPHNNSKPALHSPSSTSTKSFDLQVANWRMESIVRDSDSDSDDEFFDCQGTQTYKILGGMAACIFCVFHNDMNDLCAYCFRIFK